MLISQDQIVINFKWDSVVAITLSGISSSTVSKPKLFEICCCQSSCCLQSSNIWPRKQFEGVFATILLPGSCRCYACVLVEINDIPATLVDMESVLQKLWQFPQRNFWSSWTQQAQSSSKVFQKLKTCNVGIYHQSVCINLRSIMKSYVKKVNLLFCCGHSILNEIIIVLLKCGM